MNRKQSTSIAMDETLRDAIDEYARSIFGDFDLPRSRSAAARILIRLGLTDDRRHKVQR